MMSRTMDMRNHIFSSLAILCLLSTVFLIALTFSVQPERASGTIYIRADGSIDPPTTPIDTTDNVTYTFTEHINDSIVVERDNIVIRGEGHLLQGNGSNTGLDLTSRTNVTVKDLRITNFRYGLRVNHSTMCLITRSNITANNAYGIYLYRSSHNSISGNNITANTHGVWLYFSSRNSVSANKINENDLFAIWIDIESNYNNVSGNTITNNWYGVYLSLSSYNTISENEIANNRGNFRVDGGGLSHFVNDVDVSNTVDGKPVYYWINESYGTVPSDAGYVALVNCTGIRVQNLNLTNNGQGILIAYTQNTTIRNNNMANNSVGVFLDHSSHNSILGNNITANDLEGVFLDHSSHNSILGNNITANKRAGAEIHYSIYNSISDNDIAANDRFGVLLGYSSYNTVSGNNITANDFGVNLLYSSTNTFCHNSLIDNVEQIISGGYPNIWDDGYPSGGNYWSDHDGADFHSGPYQNEIGSDGICDTPYLIDVYNTDNHPLMGEFFSFNTSLGKKVNVVSNSTIEDFRYFSDNNTIKMFVANMTLNQTTGFCRVATSHALMDITNIEVIIDNGTTPLLYHNYTLYDNGTHRWIYFSYPHSIREIDIVPEFSSLLILPFFMIAALLVVAVYRRKSQIY